jgi:hypothetical protein
MALPAPNERHDLHLVPLFQRLVIPVAAREPAVPLDGHLLRRQVVSGDQVTQGRAIGDFLGVTVYADRHGSDYSGEISHVRVGVLASIFAWCYNIRTMAKPSASPLRISENRRFVLRADGSPFFWLGDTAWELFHRCNREEADLYLDDRASKRFTVIQAVVLAELDGLNTPNSLGHKPLHDNDPAKPNEEYFKHVDYVVRKANSLGMFIGMLPTWGDKFNKIWGAGPEVFTPENARVYGRFLGQRYKDADIIWILGGDRPLHSDHHLRIIRSMAEGITEGDGGRHLKGFHPPGGDSSSTYVHAEPWLDFHAIQSGHVRDKDNYHMIERDRNRLPFRPCVDMEPGYEDHPNSFNLDKGWLDEHDVRKSLYCSLFAGAFGYTYGCHDIWQMYMPGRNPISWARTPWKDAIHFPGSAQIQHARALMESRPFTTREPAQWLIKSDVGSAESHIRATRAADGSYAMVYLPVGQRVTIDMTKISGKAKAWWYNPRTGAATEIGEFDNVETRQFTCMYDKGGRDWVLVLDDASKGYPPPGRGTPA